MTEITLRERILTVLVPLQFELAAWELQCRLPVSVTRKQLDRELRKLVAEGRISRRVRREFDKVSNGPMAHRGAARKVLRAYYRLLPA